MAAARLLVLVAIGVFALERAAFAVEITFTIADVRNAKGLVMVELCPEDQFLKEDECPYRASAEAVKGETEVHVTDVPPGVYGVQGFHDANGNGEMDRNFVGWPLEGFVFANDPTILLNAPSFEDAAVTVGEEDMHITMTMRYRTP